MAKSNLDTKRLIRSRTTGFILIGVMGFLTAGYFFGFNEYTAVAIGEDLVEVCPPFCDDVTTDAPLQEIPVPDTSIPEEIIMTPIITTIDNDGNESVLRGEGTVLTALTGLSITKSGSDANFDNGRLKIDLEFTSGNPINSQLSVLGKLKVFEDGVEIDEVPINIVGITEDGVLVTEVYNKRYDTIITEDGTFEYRFSVNSLSITVTGSEFKLVAPQTIYTTVLTKDTTIESEVAIEEEEIPPPDEVQPVVEDVPVDTMGVPCVDDVKNLDVSIGFPSAEVSGVLYADAFENGSIIFGSNDILDVKQRDSTNTELFRHNWELRNNRECILTFTVETFWTDDSGIITDIKSDVLTLDNQETVSVVTPFVNTLTCEGTLHHHYIIKDSTDNAVSSDFLGTAFIDFTGSALGLCGNTGAIP